MLVTALLLLTLGAAAVAAGLARRKAAAPAEVAQPEYSPAPRHLDPVRRARPALQAALRILRVAMEGVRLGRAPDAAYAEAAFGDAVRRLADGCPDVVNARLVLAFTEALRHCRRSFHTRPGFRDDPIRRQTVRWQH